MSYRRGGLRTARALSVLAPIVGIGLAVPLALAGTAGAAESTATAVVNEYGWQLTYTAAPGQANDVAVTQSYNDDRTQYIYVIDDVVPITAGNGCSYPDSADRTKVTCAVENIESQSPYAALEADLGDGNDAGSVENRTDQIFSYNSVELGLGDDKWTSGAGERVDGSSVKGGAGDDVITVGGYGSSLGGDGADTLTATGGGEILQGGAGDDVLRGGAGEQIIKGDDGDDTVYGGAGDDELYGGKGDDIVYGEAGDDRIWGNSGNDKLYGGAGTDTISGGAGTNVIVQD
ncbi:calcium-binding protein [Streptomyces sp. NPDC057620]|uniref:calcium-binding protein n=1 Tax=Streptomyces sp. NPDC057620 TaxID=3346185 RepID=UPI00367F8268